jgi:hypothetical protein
MGSPGQEGICFQIKKLKNTFFHGFITILQLILEMKKIAGSSGLSNFLKILNNALSLQSFG